MNYFYGRPKYGNKKTEVDGIIFDSKKEAQRYGELQIMLKAGLIKDLELQPKYILLENFTDVWGRKWRQIYYKGDFRYVECDDGTLVVEDVKGFKTKEFLLKEKLFRHRYPSIKLIVE
jgi:hypothetical protein